MSSFDRKVLIILLVLALLLGGVILSGSLVGLPAPALRQQLEKDSPALTSARGPLTLEFPEAMQLESVQVRLEPAAAGRLTWEGAGSKTLMFLPESPLLPGQRYELTLSEGAASQSGQVTRQEYTWPVEVRQPEVLYLSPTDAPELWRLPPDGTESVQLTATGGKVFDYSTTWDGSRVVYSARNGQGGVDLWEMDRDGGNQRLLLPCQADWCINPAYSSDGAQLAYARRRANLNAGGPPGVPRLWLLDMAALTTEALYVDPNVGGFEPSWSPDGRYLAFFDGLSNGIRILNFQAKTDFFLPSQMGMNGTWSPDSTRLVYNNYQSDSLEPSALVFEVNARTQQVRQLFAKPHTPTEYSPPAWSPNGSEILVAMRPFNGAPGKQLWLADVGDEAGQITNFQAVTEDPTFNHAAYRWSPTGQKVVYQRLKMGSSQSLPVVVVWDRETGEMTVAAEDAFAPRWLP